MATMNISLPDQMREWVETLQNAITKGFDSVDSGELDMAAIKLKARQWEGEGEGL